jgi:hypothetical protein
MRRSTSGDISLQEDPAALHACSRPRPGAAAACTRTLQPAATATATVMWKAKQQDEELTTVMYLSNWGLN